MIPTQRVFIAGNSGSGKTTGAWRWYLSRMPRRIVLDQTGEWEGYTDITATSLTDFVSAVREMHSKPKWTIAYTLDDDRFDDLIRWLIPVPNVYASPVTALGGAVMLVDEVDLVAGQNNTSREVRTLYRRSRHTGLTVVSATTRPANVSREVSAQSTHILAYHLSEPRDRDYIADIMRWDSQAVDRWMAWTRLHPHGAAWKEAQTGRLLWLPDQGPPLADSKALAALAASPVASPPLLSPSPPQPRQLPESPPVAESQDNPEDDEPDG